MVFADTFGKVIGHYWTRMRLWFGHSQSDGALAIALARACVWYSHWLFPSGVVRFPRLPCLQKISKQKKCMFHIYASRSKSCVGMEKREGYGGDCRIKMPLLIIEEPRCDPREYSIRKWMDWNSQISQTRLNDEETGMGEGEI